MHDHDLTAIQRRFYELVTAGEGVIEPTLLVGPVHRLEVYAEMYVARLLDVLIEDFPKLHAALGATAFRQLAETYVRACPPTSFTVREVGGALSGYLARTDLPSWASDLAALERARVEVFDARDVDTRSREDLAAVPLERFPSLDLSAIPAVQLVRLAWNADELWSAIEDGIAHPEPVACERSVLVWRRDGQVFHRTLDPDETELIPLLLAGTCPGDLATQLAGVSSEPELRLVELLGRWLDAQLLVA